MRLKLKKVFCLCLVAYIVIFSNTLTFADDTKGDDSQIKDLGISEENIAKGKAWVSVLKADGFSDAAIAGVLGNSVGESHWNPLADERGVNGGLFGFTPMTNFSNSDFNKNCPHTKGTAGGQSVCSDGACQIAYMLSCLENSFSSYGKRTDKYNEFIAKYGVSHTNDEHNSTVTVAKTVPSCSSLDSYKSATDPQGAAAVFCICYERAAGTFIPCGIVSKGVDYGDPSNWHNAVPGYKGLTWYDFFCREFNTTGTRFKAASVIYTWISGLEFIGSSTTPSSESTEEQELVKQEQEAIVQQLAFHSYWSEEEISSFCNLYELDLNKVLDGATRDNLSGNQLEAVDNWNNTINDMSKKGSLLYIARIILMISGIIMCIWAILFYVGFWFDRTNNFLDFSVVKILTLGRLQASYSDNDKCTYGLENSDGNKKQAKTINHRIALCITVFTIIVASLIISGNIYKLLRSLIYKILILLES